MRRFVSLLITVIWIATALQPCVMASVVESHPQSLETHHSESSSIVLGKTDHSVCPHCKNTEHNQTPCGSQPDENCDGNDTLAYYERVKPVDTERLYEQFQSFTLNHSRNIKGWGYSSPVTPLSESLQLPAGPPLRDLYRVYLK